MLNHGTDRRVVPAFGVYLSGGTRVRSASSALANVKPIYATVFVFTVLSSAAAFLNGFR